MIHFHSYDSCIHASQQMSKKCEGVGKDRNGLPVDVLRSLLRLAPLTCPTKALCLCGACCSDLARATIRASSVQAGENRRLLLSDVHASLFAIRGKSNRSTSIGRLPNPSSGVLTTSKSNQERRGLDTSKNLYGSGRRSFSPRMFVR